MARRLVLPRERVGKEVVIAATRVIQQVQPFCRYENRVQHGNNEPVMSTVENGCA